METKHILKIPFETSNNPVTPDLLLCVTSPSKTTTSALPDLTIQATEGESAFTGNLYSSRLSKILSQDAGVSVQEFEAVLAHILLHKPLPASKSQLQDVSAIAIWSRDEGSKRSSIRLRFKREISNIRHYLGEIVLKADSDVELDVLDWTRVAVARALSAEREMAALQLRMAEAEKGVQLIREQLDELLQVKTRDEEVLMGKFVSVLNEKKARIRELEVELGRGGRPWPEVDEEVKVEEVEDSVMDGRASKGKKGKQAVRQTGTKFLQGRKRKQADTQAESESTFGAPQNRDDQEDQQENDVETDREGMSDVPGIENEDIDMSGESDDLEALSHPQSTKARPKRGASKSSQLASSAKGKSKIAESQKQETSGKQHALRTKKLSPSASEDEGTTDDEL